MAVNNALNNTLQTPFTLGATSVTSTGTQLNYLASLTAVPINKVVSQVFTSNGTYTPTTGMVYCAVELVGSGGGSGGTTGAAGQSAASGGGGGGGFCRKVYTAANIGANASVVIGAAGAAGASGNNAGGNAASSTFTPAGTGVTLTAGGGTGGGGCASSATVGNSSAGGAGGTGTNGDVNVTGGFGVPGIVISGAASLTLPGNGGGVGGGFGVGQNCQQLNATTAVINYGNGACGTPNIGGANAVGLIGATGICYIREFISA